MSYYATFKPTEEAIKKLKPFVNTEKNKQWISDTKNEILLKCLIKSDMTDFIKVSNELRYLLRALEKSYQDESKQYCINRYNEEDSHEVWFCGWEYSRPCNAPDMEDVTDYVLRDLLVLKFIVPTPDYFEDSEKFFDKLNEINEKIEYFCESASKAEDFRIMEELKEFRVNDYDEAVEELKKDKEQLLDGEYVVGEANSVSVSGDEERSDITKTLFKPQTESMFEENIY